MREGGRHRKILTRRVKLVRMETDLSYIASLLEKRMPGLHHREKRQKQVEYFLLMTSICNYFYSHFCFLSFPGKDFHSCGGRENVAEVKQQESSDIIIIHIKSCRHKDLGSRLLGPHPLWLLKRMTNNPQTLISHILKNSAKTLLGELGICFVA